jgi:hypothetical protein
MVQSGENSGLNLANIHQVANAIAANPLPAVVNSSDE